MTDTDEKQEAEDLGLHIWKQRAEQRGHSLMDATTKIEELEATVEKLRGGLRSLSNEVGHELNCSFVKDIQDLLDVTPESNVRAIEARGAERERAVIVKWVRGFERMCMKDADEEFRSRRYWYEGVAADIETGNQTLAAMREAADRHEKGDRDVRD